MRRSKSRFLFWFWGSEGDGGCWVIYGWRRLLFFVLGYVGFVLFGNRISFTNYLNNQNTQPHNTFIKPFPP